MCRSDKIGLLAEYGDFWKSQTNLTPLAKKN